MRIAYVCADGGVPVFGKKGCSVHVQEVVRAMLNLGAEVEIFAAQLGGEWSPGLEKAQVHSLLSASKGSLADRERVALVRNAHLRQMLTERGPFDLVYERYSLWSHGAMEWARDEGVPGVLEVNAPLIEEQAKYRGLVDRRSAEEVARRAFGAATLLVAVSPVVAQYLNEFACAKGRVTVVPNGICPHRFSRSVEPACPHDPCAFTVGFLGTLKPWHGLETLAESFAMLHLHAPYAKLLVVGDGPERKSMVEDLRTRGLSESAIFVGAVEPEEVPRWLAAMDVGVAPYPNQPDFYFSPLKVFEYMAAGLPVVASRIGSLEDIVQDGVHGHLCDPDEPQDFVRAMEGLIYDEAKRSRMGRAAREDVFENHTWEGNVRRVLKSLDLHARADAGCEV
jgi:glycosyltransferase involved in cell wall biosynthesis